MDIFDKKYESGIMDFEEFFDRFHNFVRHSRFSLDAVWRPSVDIVESESEITIIAELAGVKREDMEISYKDGIIRIKGIRRQSHLGKKNRITQLEIEHGRFERMVKVGRGINEEKLSVSLDNGILEIVLPFREKKKMRKIEIEE